MDHALCFWRVFASLAGSEAALEVGWLCVFSRFAHVYVCASVDSTFLRRQALDYMAIACTCIHDQHYNRCGCSHTLLDKKKPSDCTWTSSCSYDH